MFERFTDRSRRVLVLAQEEARMLKHDYIGTEHILLGLIREGEGIAARVLESLSSSLEAIGQQVEEIIGEGQQVASGHIPFTPRAKKVFELSLREALQLGHNYIGTEHILLGLIREGEGVAAQVLIRLGADLNWARTQVIQLLRVNNGKEPTVPAIASPEPTSAVLDQFGRNLTLAARMGKLDPVVGRGAEIARLIQIMLLRVRNNPLLVGEPGVGKSAVVAGLALRIATGRTMPELIKGKLVYALDPAALDPGVQQGDPAGRLQEIMTEVRKRGDIILVIDELPSLMSPDTAGKSAWEMLEPALARGEIQSIVTATPAEYQLCRDQGAAIERRFQPIQVAEPTVAQTIEILDGLRSRYQAHHRVQITDAMIAMAVELADQHLPNRSRPGKAVDLLDLAAAQLRARHESELNPRITEIRRDRKSAIDRQDFEQAAALRSDEKELVSRWEASVPWDNENTSMVLAEAIAVLSDDSPRRIATQRGQRHRPRYPAVAAGADPQVWAMS
jgi:ATP-dependent Clp protease ATP-binding subunit ClpC